MYLERCSLGKRQHSSDLSSCLLFSQIRKPVRRRLEFQGILLDVKARMVFDGAPTGGDQDVMIEPKMPLVPELN